MVNSRRLNFKKSKQKLIKNQPGLIKFTLIVDLVVQDFIFISKILWLDDLNICNVINNSGKC
ncbi:hypothetical protein DERP_004674 [Dermatophagoides pteronyssinus]|uniref:Uncharacterized protein n=1 Tax=Dermatophagoides pteronyssinus TaxID=6956 RepID=A0ABQ8JPF7_DERPT|nr:hypothetical protein DERP_004674 [Dermatophagoides pteronyssinus]